MNAAARGALLAAAGFALGAAAVGSVWWSWPRSAPEATREVPAPPEFRQVPPVESQERTVLAPEPPKETAPRSPEEPASLPAPTPKEVPAPPPPAPQSAPSPATTPVPPLAKPLGEFFGFPVETLEQAPKAATPAPAPLPTPLPSQPTAQAPSPRSVPSRLHLEPLEGRCV